MLTLVVLAALGASPEFSAQTSGGRQVVGQLVELSANHLVLETAEGRRDLQGDVTELHREHAAKAPTAALRVDLWDGSSLAADEFTADGKQASLTLADGAKLKLDQALVSSVRMRQQPAEIAKQWNEIARSAHAEDLVVVRKQEALDSLSGVIGDVGKESLQFKLGDETITVKRAKVDGLVYARPATARSLEPAFCTLTDNTGTRLAAHRVEIADTEAKVSTGAGLEMTIPLDRLEHVQLNVRFLSDLEPEHEVYTPLLGGGGLSKAERAFFAPRLNRSLTPGGMRLGGHVYAKGLAMYTRSELVFRLQGEFRRFQALAGIDDSVRPGGNVRLSVYGDNRLLVEEVITGRDAPRRLDVDIRGVARLKIVADFNGDEVADHLDLCEARILE